MMIHMKKMKRKRRRKMSKNNLTRDEKVSKITSEISGNGWQSIYIFIDRHLTDQQLDKFIDNHELNTNTIEDESK